eukprot:TRINITY_DN1690_c1_g4_i1.p1 TRINITY_DN1690_c1_g4~~TRINITY_DN1690_c1_g4_i1.p1  ORF type:complete len:541 (+),score=37.85 TRINITY_DN1690_c1_g4_i1:53-1624(+)
MQSLIETPRRLKIVAILVTGLVALNIGMDTGDRDKYTHRGRSQATQYDVVRKGGFKWFLGTCGSVKSNGAWLREWIELQKMAGVDHVWLVNDQGDSPDDGTEAILLHYQDEGFLTIIPGAFPEKIEGCELPPKAGKMSNCVAPKFCFREVAPYVDWLVFIDSDEFMYPRTGCNLNSYIKNTCNPWQTHLEIKWERFGSSGHETHPMGLMTENFLESAGECEHETSHNEYNTANNPFYIIGTCVHQKVMYNTKCLTVEHAGWIHWPVNTSDWIAGDHPYSQQKMVKNSWKEYPSRNGAPFKDNRCVFTPYFKQLEKCTDWLTTGGGSETPVRYSSECCTAGIGYNHYGMKSMQYWKHKMDDVSFSQRGRKVGDEYLWRIDVKGVVSFNILKYLRAIRKVHTNLGIPVSRRVAFIDDKESSSTCFTEKHYQYVPAQSTNTLVLKSINSASCCHACAINPNCSGFTLSRATKECQLLLPTPFSTHLHKKPVPPRRRWIRTVIPGSRVLNYTFVSGVVLRDGECPAV